MPPKISNNFIGQNRPVLALKGQRGTTMIQLEILSFEQRQSHHDSPLQINHKRTKHVTFFRVPNLPNVLEPKGSLSPSTPTSIQHSVIAQHWTWYALADFIKFQLFRSKTPVSKEAAINQKIIQSRFSLTDRSLRTLKLLQQVTLLPIHQTEIPILCCDIIE